MKFETLSDYSNVNFSKLNAFLTDDKQKMKYYENLSQQCAAVMKSASNIEIALWDLRIQKSLKQVFTSASFFIESKFALKNNCLTSHYFLSYYALFHAFTSVLWVDPIISIGKIVEMPHDKVKNNFVSNYAKGKRQIITADIEQEFEMLKFYREYYSYSMPFNAFFSDVPDLKKAEDFLEDRLVHCFQIATLLSNIWEKSFEKYGKGKPRLTIANWREIDDWFYKVFCKPHPIKKEDYVVEFTDHVIRSDMRNAKGGYLYSFSILLEHCYDQFNCYANADGIEYPFAREITTFLFDAIA
jgi:hypothetical protein